MKIQYCSDLHLEFQENKNFLKNNPIKPVGEILLLAGDIVMFKTMKEHNDFFSYCADNFEATYWIPGNHEYYYDDIGVKLHEQRNVKIKDNVFLFNNCVVIHKNIELILSTMWSYIPPQFEFDVKHTVTDFQLIKYEGKKLTVSCFNEMHQQDLIFIQAALTAPTDKQRIVVTHHVPTLMHYPAQYKNSNINGAFAVELYDFIENCNATHWIYGHHHCNTPAFKIGNTTMLTNQLGYVGQKEHLLFNPAAIIEI